MKAGLKKYILMTGFVSPFIYVAVAQFDWRKIR